MTSGSTNNINVIAVIPAFNEELAIGSIVIRTVPFVTKVVVVDDGSLDKTSYIAEHAGAEVIQLSKNHGKSHAVLRGFDRARQMNADCVVMLDGDGQHYPEDIPAVIAPVLRGDADLVIGSRFCAGITDVPFHRRIGQKTLNIFTKFASSYKSTDSQSGFRALSQKALDSFLIEPAGYEIESVMISYLSDKGFRLTEVPISVKYSVPNKHKMNFMTHGLAILSNLIGVIGYRRPLISFGIPGVILLLIGLYLGIWAFSEYTIYRVFPFSLVLSSSLFLIIGLLFLNTALVLNSVIQLLRHRK
jgi:glycosyltransferase involved in cell wall biosynthesis